MPTLKAHECSWETSDSVSQKEAENAARLFCLPDYTESVLGQSGKQKYPWISTCRLSRSFFLICGFVPKYSRGEGWGGGGAGQAAWERSGFQELP